MKIITVIVLALILSGCAATKARVVVTQTYGGTSFSIELSPHARQSAQNGES